MIHQARVSAVDDNIFINVAGERNDYFFLILQSLASIASTWLAFQSGQVYMSLHVTPWYITQNLPS